MVTNGYNLLRTSCARIDAEKWVGFLLRGEDRLEWLQGQATNDLRQLKEGGSISFCLCTPTGQLEAIVDAWSLPDALLLTCDREMADAIRHRVDQMVILEDVTLDPIDLDLELVSIQGPTACHEASSLLNGKNPSPCAEMFVLGGGGGAGVGVIFAPSSRAGQVGIDLWLPHALAEEAKERFPLVDEAAYEAARIEAGIPAWNRDATPKTLPPELGSAFEAAHISYQKGCYVGQEVLMRIHSRGHTNRTWVALLTEKPVQPGATVSHPDRQDAGIVTSAAASPTYGPIVAASLRTDFAAPGTRVEIQTPDGPALAEIRSMPLVK